MAEREIQLTRNDLLFGHNKKEGIVAVEPDDDTMIICIRRGGELVKEVQPFVPFLVLSDPSLLKGYKGEYEVKRLSGGQFFNHMALFPSWKGLDKARSAVQKASSVSPGHPDSPQLYISDPVHQHLLITGQTLFKGMDFDQLHRLQLDIETFCEEGYEFPNPEREVDRIIAVSMSDNRGFERVICDPRMSEEEMLREMVRIIREKDPDVIEGHNIYKFDLPYISARARLRRVELALGRDESEPKVRNSRLTVAERTIDYPRWEVHGRHVVDTWILAQFYDVSTRELESYGLKDIARQLGIAADDRTYLDPGRISWYFEHDPDTLMDYALDDVRETRALSEILSRSYFIQAKIFPYSYQNVIVRGNATKIDSLFIREYLRRGHSIPKPDEVRAIVGGLTGLFETGTVKNVAHCDVRSLYPSIMLSSDIKPHRDDLGIFGALLRDLVNFRLEARERARKAGDPGEKAYHDALQGTFKIIINSFYGYLGHSFARFSDFDQAERVTATGREILQTMMRELRERGCRIVEVDTDGIYFTMEGEGGCMEEAERVVNEITGSLPKGIQVEVDGFYGAMFSYKIKNYALLDMDGRLTIHGSGLKSRGLERFQRHLLQQMIHLTLTDRAHEIESLYQKMLEEMAGHRLDVKMFMKTETLQEPLSTYKEKVEAKKRNRSALYELALAAGRDYRPGDQISYYVTGDSEKVSAYENCKLASDWDPKNPDENVKYYQKKLTDLYRKFSPVLLGGGAESGNDGEDEE